MPPITNKNYKQFLESGIIDLIGLDKLKEALANIKGKRRLEGRALLICLYYTGARPVEVLSLKGSDFQRQDSYVTVMLHGAKRGLTRRIYLPYRLALVKELYNYATSCPPTMFIFHHFRGSYKRKLTKKDGTVYYLTETTYRLRWHIDKWFKGVINDSISPYFLRHNRFSQLSEAGATAQELQMLKGAKSVSSVQPYLHLSTRGAKKLAKKLK